MKCEDCQIFIEEFFDGELKDALAANVKTHIAACHECSALWDELQREQEVYLRYQRDVEVTPALWAAVQARIAQEKPVVASPGLFDKIKTWLGSTFAAPKMSFAYTAALVLIAVGATVAVMSYINSRGRDTNELVARSNGNDARPEINPPANPAPSQNGSSDVQPGPVEQAGSKDLNSSAPSTSYQPPRRTVSKPKAQPTPEQLVREAEQKYVAAIAILTRDVNKRRSDLDPVVKARFDTALAAIDRTIQETRQAVRRNPNDPVALQYMLSAYAKKVEVLRDIADD
jgi:hypothetical protein